MTEFSCINMHFYVILMPLVVVLRIQCAFELYYELRSDVLECNEMTYKCVKNKCFIPFNLNTGQTPSSHILHSPFIAYFGIALFSLSLSIPSGKKSHGSPTSLTQLKYNY